MLIEMYAADPNLDLMIDLPSQTIVLPDEEEVKFPIDAFSKTCLLNGVDELGYILGLEEHIQRYEMRS